MDFFKLVKLISGENTETRWEFSDTDSIISGPPLLSSLGESKVEDMTRTTQTIVPSEISDTNIDGFGDVDDESVNKQRTESVDDTEETKKKKKKQKKKKNRSRANSAITPGDPKHVHWGDVNEFLFARDIGEGTVPNSGLYPVALGDECARVTTTVDDYTHTQQLNLLQRVVDMGLSLDSLNISSPASGESDDAVTSKSCYLESRQFDYKKGTSNPLFSPIPETERVAIITELKGHSRNAGMDITAINKEISDLRKGRNDVGCSCKAIKVDKLGVAKLKQELIHHRDMFQRQQLCKLAGVDEGNVENMYSRGRADSIQTDTSEASEDVNPQDSKRTVSEDDIGQSGDPLDGSYSAEQCMKLTNDEIQKLSKSHLMAYMRAMVQSCPLCVSNNCACVASGIGCHANVCGCFRYNSKQSCQNVMGVIQYDPYKVQQHRQQFVSSETGISYKVRPSRANTT